MSTKPKDRKVGPWAREKLKALDECLNYYTTRLKKTPFWSKVYVDAFAGPGIAEVRKRPPANAQTFELFPDPDAEEEEIEFLRGSPRVALELRNPFDHYVFIERDPERVAELRALREEHPERSIDIREGDANENVLALLKTINKGKHRGYAFLDPFGMQMPWSTIQAIAATRAMEVMINFPLGMAIRRMMPVDGDFPKGWRISLDTFFGSGEWEPHAYEQVADMFGGFTRKSADSESRLLNWYQQRLTEAFGYASTPMLITNTRGGPLYYLIWAGSREEGLKGAEHILGKKGRARRSASRTA